MNKARQLWITTDDKWQKTWPKIYAFFYMAWLIFCLLMGLYILCLAFQSFINGGWRELAGYFLIGYQSISWLIELLKTPLIVIGCYIFFHLLVVNIRDYYFSPLMKELNKVNDNLEEVKTLVAKLVLAKDK